MTRGNRGWLAVMIAPFFMAMAAIAAPAQTFTVLHSFSGTDGSTCEAPLILDSLGNLYGTTSLGGAFNAGTVFDLTPVRVETVLHSFSGHQDGGYPIGGLVRDAAGNFVGTTTAGGRDGIGCTSGSGSGCGLVFSLSPSGVETVLHSFKGYFTDGLAAASSLITDKPGNFYGVTFSGGVFDGSGTLFKVTPAGVETVLHTFNLLSGQDAAAPRGSLVLSAAGDLYGTSTRGGTYNQGTVFKASTTGQELPIYSFTGSADGCFPVAGVVLDEAGDMYGTTYPYDGPCGGYGTVFKLDPSGELTVLYSFTGHADGAYPVAGVVRDIQGNLYGTTWFGGNAGGFLGNGVVYKVDPSGNETVLHTFTGGTDGGRPVGGLVIDAAGNLYGTTTAGGSNGDGVIFEITP